MNTAMGFSVTARGDREIMVTRDFNAPREMVWDAMTQPEHLRRWMLGPPGWTMTACEDDPRVGGKYRIAWRGPEGEDLAMSGTYREVTHPSRIVRTESFSMAGRGPYISSGSARPAIDMDIAISATRGRGAGCSIEACGRGSAASHSPSATCSPTP